MRIKMRADDFNEEFYNDIAKQYDKGYHPENWERKNTTEQEIGFIASNLIRDGRTLEIGAGQGRLTGTIAKLSKSVVAADISEEMLRIAAERNKDKNNIEYVKKDIKELHLLSGYGQFDTVVFYWLLPHIEDMLNVLEIVRGAVKKSGIIIFNMWNKDSIYCDYLAKKRNEMEVRNAVSEHWGKGSVYTKFLTYNEMMQLIEDADLEIDNELNIGFVPLQVYRGGRFLFSVFKVTEFIGKRFFKHRCYNQLFACIKK